MNIHQYARMPVHDRVHLMNGIIGEEWRAARAVKAAGIGARTACK
ncbi:MAG: leucine zipper domain-containing protein [Methylocella sp.]